MAKKGHARGNAEPASPKRLRRKLEKLEAQLAGANDKRDRAQARVDALAIMADEVRAAITAAQPAPAAPTVEAGSTAKPGSSGTATPRRTSGASRSLAKKRPTAASAKAVTTRSSSKNGQSKAAIVIDESRQDDE